LTDDITEQPLLQKTPIRRNTLIKDVHSALGLPKWYQDRDARSFCTMFILVGGYFLVEIVWGVFIGSLALVADSVHNLSDLIALLLGFISLQASKKERTSSATFGYYRMEVVGGLINATLLVGICLSLLLDALQRFFEPPSESLNSNGLILIIVASIGLAINLGGAFMFSGHHGHSHGGHGGHGHHGHGGQHDDNDEKKFHSNPGSSSENEITVIHLTKSGKRTEHPKPIVAEKTKSRPNLNVRAAFLHAMGDALGSLGVIISGIIIYFVKDERKHLADPICTIFISCLIFQSAFPLIKQTLAILLQKVPDHINLVKIQEEILKVRGIYQIHDVHVWQLSQEKNVASLHVLISANSDFMMIADQVKNIFHSHGIHASTIQPEFITETFTTSDGDLCHEVVCDKECHKKSCCPPSNNPKDISKS